MTLTNKILNSLATIQNFPKDGIVFRDIMPLFLKPNLIDEIIEDFANKIKHWEVDAIVGIESRGFLFGTILSQKINLPFIPARKPGKLPPPIISAEYKLEYGKDRIEIQKESISSFKNFLIVDDVLATGGTAAAVCELIQNQNKNVKGLCVLIELSELKGIKKIPQTEFGVYSILNI